MDILQKKITLLFCNYYHILLHKLKKKIILNQINKLCALFNNFKSKILFITYISRYLKIRDHT